VRERPTGSRERPSLQQFDAMQIIPFQYVGQRPFRKGAIDLAGFELDGDFEIAVDGMEMSRSMSPVVHGDDDPKESTEFRHWSF